MFKVKDIRPEDLMEETKRLFGEDLEEIIKLKNNFVQVNCPACNSRSSSFCFEKNSFIFEKCTDCATLFNNPRPTALMLKEFYENSKYRKHWNEKVFPASENIRRNKIFVPRAQRIIELCNKHNVNTDLLVDVGAGYGTFCEEIKKLGYFKKVIALDPSPEHCQIYKKKSLNYIQNTIEEAELNNVSVITNFELIEHLYCPQNFIKASFKALSPGGLFIITTPNINGFDLLNMGKLHDNIGGPYHINLFNIDSLRKLLEKEGFNMIEFLTPGQLDSEIVRNAILSGELDVLNQPCLKFILIDQWDNIGKIFQNFLIENNLFFSFMDGSKKRNIV